MLANELTAEVAARLDADLHRLRFGHSRAVGADKDANYIAALTRFAVFAVDNRLSQIGILQRRRRGTAAGAPGSTFEVPRGPRVRPDVALGVGGQAELRSGGLPGHDGVAASQFDDDVVVEVRDEGPGIGPEDMARLRMSKKPSAWRVKWAIPSSSKPLRAAVAGA